MISQLLNDPYLSQFIQRDLPSPSEGYGKTIEEDMLTIHLYFLLINERYGFKGSAFSYKEEIVFKMEDVNALIDENIDKIEREALQMIHDYLGLDYLDTWSIKQLCESLEIEEYFSNRDLSDLIDYSAFLRLEPVEVYPAWNENKA